MTNQLHVHVVHVVHAVPAENTAFISKLFHNAFKEGEIIPRRPLSGRMGPTTDGSIFNK